MPEVEIIRKEVLLVEKCEPKIYQNETQGIIVTCKDGKTHTVNLKHRDLWPIFQPGMAVEVGYGEYMKKEFIHTARQVKDALPVPVPPAPVKTPPGTPQQATQPKEHLSQAVKMISGDTKDRGVALSYAKDLVAAGIIGIADIFPTADKFLKYILNIRQ